MPVDPLGHLLVARLAGGDERYAARLRLGEPNREPRLAATRAAEKDDERHRRSGRTNTPASSWTTRTFAP